MAVGLERLIDILRDLEQDPSEEELLEVLWLADRLGAKSRTESGRTQPAPETEPADESKLTSGPPIAEPGRISARAKRVKKPQVQDARPGNTRLHLPTAGDFRSADAISAIAVRISSVPAVPTGLDLFRALRPLKRKRPIGRTHHLDEDATAHRIAEQDLWVPVLRAEPLRALELAFIVDGYSSMDIWWQTVRELHRLFEQLGAFRDVRVWELMHELGTAEGLGVRPYGSSGAPRDPRELVDPRGWRTFLVLSDCIGPAWRSHAAQHALADWGRHSPVAILQPLPQRFWPHCAANPIALQLAAQTFGVANARLEWTTQDRPTRTADKLPVPVLELDTPWLASWARLVSGSAGTGVHAMALLVEPAEPVGHSAAAPQASEVTLTAAERIRRFSSVASPGAVRLAHYLAAAPISLPIIRLVQYVMLREPDPAQRAEVFLGGLLRRVAPGKDGNPDEVQYDFQPGVREALLDRLGSSDALCVLRAVSDYLAERARLAFDFRALLAGRAIDGDQLIGSDSRPFAYAAEKVLRRLGGRYAGMAALLAVRAGIRDKPAPSDALPPAHSPHEPPAVWGNVPTRNSHFVGREDLLRMLDGRLSIGPAAVLPEALHGMGGVGKSQLAIEYIYRHTADYDLIWWISAERPALIQHALVELAAELDLRVSQEVNVAVPAVLEALRLGRPYRDWLLVFDNADDVEAVRPFLPLDGPGRIIVTSRNRGWTSLVPAIEVDVFTRSESMDLLRRRGPGLPEENIDELAEVLGDLPLAIEQAAVWLTETRMPVEEYLRLFRTAHDKAAAELLSEVAGPISYELPVAAAWNVSLDRMREVNPAALRLLQVCAFFAPEPIPRQLLSGGRNVEGPPELLEALGDPIKLGRAFRAINQYALAKLSHRDNTIILHRLVQQVIVSQLSPEENDELRHCAHQLLANADPNAPEDPEYWQRYAELLPHVLYSRIIECDDSSARELVLNEIAFLSHWEDHQGLLDLSQQVVGTWTELHGADHRQTLTAGLYRGRALRLSGHFSTAHEVHLQVRDILLDIDGPEGETTLEAQRYVAADLRFLGDFQAALELDRDSYAVALRRFGPDDPTTLEHAYRYAIDLRLTGDPASALELDQESLQRRLVVLGEEHFGTLRTAAAIALDEIELGRYRQARHDMRQLVQRKQVRYGEAHPGTIEDLTTLSVTERKAGDAATALRLSNEALARLRSRYGNDYPSTFPAALNHAVNLRQNGELAASAELAAQTTQRYEAQYGAHHPDTAAARINLAVVLRLTGELDQAREMDESALAVLTDSVGAAHPRTVVCRVNHASDLAALGHHAAAHHEGLVAMRHARATLGSAHPTTLACAVNLSYDMQRLDQHAEARGLIQDSTARLRQTLGQDHPITRSASASLRIDLDVFPIPL